MRGTGGRCACAHPGSGLRERGMQCDHAPLGAAGAAGWLYLPAGTAAGRMEGNSSGSPRRPSATAGSAGGGAPLPRAVQLPAADARNDCSQRVENAQEAGQGRAVLSSALGRKWNRKTGLIRSACASNCGLACAVRACRTPSSDPDKP